MIWTMILRMSGATLLYVLVTGGLWAACHRKASLNKGWKILIGLIYGLSAVAANHFGIDYGNLLLNVRDIGPLAAGLFFSPLSGIIAGTIGGVERIVAGELWFIGKFTELACGLSTFLAGIFAAILSKAVYEGKRPPMTHAFFIGAVTEVFHMYAVLFTNRNDMATAYEVVETAAVPMILFTAVGLSLCSAVIMKLAKETSDIGWKMSYEYTPVTVLFQRALLVVTLVLFIFNFIFSYNLQTRMVTENITRKLDFFAYEKGLDYEESGMEKLKNHLKEQTETDETFILVNIRKREVEDFTYWEGDPYKISANDMKIFEEHADQEAFRTSLDLWAGTEAFVNVSTLGTDYYLLICRDADSAYESRKSQMYESTLSDILIFAVFYMLVAILVDRLVVRNLQRVNTSLRKITGGNLNETVWVHTSAEFTELSEDINKTVTALRGYIGEAEQRLKNELKMAATIQDSALPKNFRLPSSNIELYALMTPAKTVGGDFYDFFYIGRDQLCLVIADVSGKGVPASLFMMRAKTNIKNYARSGNGAAELLQHVNNTLCEGNDADMFVSVWLGILDLKTGRMQCANAGHEYPVMMSAGSGYKLVKDKHGLVLAAMENIPLTEYEILMKPGDKLFVYTDGVPEAINTNNEAYGTKRLTERLNRVRNNSQEYILQDILQDIRNFAGDAEQFDDITMLGLTYLYTEE